MTADELRPVANNRALDGYRKTVYHRRGYAGSSAVEGSGSIARDAADCAALLTELGIDRAHVVGLSFSGAIALQLASDVPARTHSLTLIEPPPVHIPRADEFRAANERLLASRRDRGLQEALDEFLTIVVGADWRKVMEEELPGSVAQVRRDAAAFFDTDIPALLEWRFGPEQAARVECPSLYIGGSESGPWFDQVHDLILAWVPHAEDVIWTVRTIRSLSPTHRRSPTPSATSSSGTRCSRPIRKRGHGRAGARPDQSAHGARALVARHGADIG